MRCLPSSRSTRTGPLRFSLPHFAAGLAAVAGVLALLLSMLSTPKFLVVFVATVAAGMLAAGSAVYFLRSRSALLFVALLPGLLGAYAIVDTFAQLLAGRRLVELLG